MSLNSLSFIGDVHIVFFCLLPGLLHFTVLGELLCNESIKLMMFSFYHTLWEIEYQII